MAMDCFQLGINLNMVKKVLLCNAMHIEYMYDKVVVFIKKK